MFENKQFSSHPKSPACHINFSMYNILVFFQNLLSIYIISYEYFHSGVDFNLSLKIMLFCSMVWEAMLEKT